MENSFKNFYHQFYRKTGGFIPTSPFHQQVYPGDFFQLRQGDMMLLGNLFYKNIIGLDKVVFDKNAKLYPSNWDIGEGVSNPYAGRGTGNVGGNEDFGFSKQVLAFAKRGSFLFRAQHPEAMRIANWGELQEQLILKLTQIMYSFRDVYVITETATAANYTIAIAGANNAELEIASAEENFGLLDLFGKEGSKTIQSRDLEYYQRESGRKPVFFKAKKLKIGGDRAQAFVGELVAERLGLDEWAGNFFSYDYNEIVVPAVATYRPCILDLLQANELNPNTALQYFSWEDAGLEDIENFFGSYGNC